MRVKLYIDIAVKKIKIKIHWHLNRKNKRCDGGRSHSFHFRWLVLIDLWFYFNIIYKSTYLHISKISAKEQCSNNIYSNTMNINDENKERWINETWRTELIAFAFAYLWNYSQVLSLMKSSLPLRVAIVTLMFSFVCFWLTSHVSKPIRKYRRHSKFMART